MGATLRRAAPYAVAATYVAAQCASFARKWNVAHYAEQDLIDEYEVSHATCAQPRHAAKYRCRELERKMQHGPMWFRVATAAGEMSPCVAECSSPYGYGTIGVAVYLVLWRGHNEA